MLKQKYFEGDREGDLWWVQSALTTKYYLISNIILSVAQGKVILFRLFGIWIMTLKNFVSYLVDINITSLSWVFRKSELFMRLFESSSSFNKEK